MNNILGVFLAQATGNPASADSGAKAGTISDLIELVVEASPVVKGVIILLILFILACVFIIVYKYILIRRAQNQTSKFLEIFWESKRLDEIYEAADDLKRSPISQLFKAGYVELSKLKGSKGDESKKDETHVGDIGNVERALRRASTAEITHLESLVPFLAQPVPQHPLSVCSEPS